MWAYTIYNALVVLNRSYIAGNAGIAQFNVTNDVDFFCSYLP